MSFMIALLGARQQQQRQSELLAPSTVIPKDEERIPLPLWLTIPDLLVSVYLILGSRQADYFLVYTTVKSALLLFFKFLFLKRVNRQVCNVTNYKHVSAHSHNQSYTLTNKHTSTNRYESSSY